MAVTGDMDITAIAAEALDMRARAAANVVAVANVAAASAVAAAAIAEASAR